MALQMVARALCNHPNGTSVLPRNSLSPDGKEFLPAEHAQPPHNLRIRMIMQMLLALI